MIYPVRIEFHLAIIITKICFEVKTYDRSPDHLCEILRSEL